jgi:MYXO-CTERM domain-containing protein
MSNQTPNPIGGCFYHHCADIAIQTAPVPDGGVVTTTPLDMSVIDMASMTTTAPPAGEDMATSTSSSGATDQPAVTPDMAQAPKANAAAGSFFGCALGGAAGATPGAWSLALTGLALLWRRRRGER